MFFQQIFEEKLAQYAYLIGCQKSGEAIIVDPMRDIDRYQKIASKNKLKIVAATETHIHADYLSGLRELAENGVKILVSDEGDKDWKYEWVIGSDYDHQLLKDTDEFNIGNIKFTTVFSPGHTPEHISFLVTDGATTDEPMGLLSGDFVMWAGPICLKQQPEKLEQWMNLRRLYTSRSRSLRLCRNICSFGRDTEPAVLAERH